MVQVVFRDDPIRSNGAIVSQVVSTSTVGFEDLLEYMSKGVVVGSADMRVVFDQFAEALKYFLSRGHKVKTSFGTYSLGLRRIGVSSSDEKGLAQSSERTIDTTHLRIRLRAAPRFLKSLKLETEIRVLPTPNLPVPFILKVENLDRDGLLDSGSSGNILHLTGNRLSFLIADLELGVFFIGETRLETRATVYRIGSSVLDCKIPELPRGVYTLEVRTRPTNTGVRIGVYERTIGVF